ncbi:unnamed protein product, partial [Oppiella nova]
MVWEQKSMVIVMLTKVFDFIRVMCCQYWPMEENKPEMYGNIEVTLLREEPLADFVIRTLKVRNPAEMITKASERSSLRSKQTSSGFKSLTPMSRSSLKSRSTRFSSMRPSVNTVDYNGTIATDYYSDPNLSYKSEAFLSARTDVYENGDHYVNGIDEDEDVLEDDVFADDEHTIIADETNERIIYQLHYHSWSSHTCPFPNSLLQFRRRVRIYMNELLMDEKLDKIGPTIVHCSDGGGRTGAYMCIDANLELAEEDGFYDVFGYAKRMKHSRKGLIENMDQYKFVYDALEEAYFCGKTWFPVDELSQQMRFKSSKNLMNQNEYFLEYQKILKMTVKPTIGDCAGGHRIENRDKNRDVSIVPPDNFRPYLTSFQSNDCTDYINAVFVDGYTRSKEYIITEWPMKKTMQDIWCLIYDHECNSVV